LLEGIDERMVDERAGRTVGTLYLALMSSLVTQWLLDPQRAPSGGDLTEALPDYCVKCSWDRGDRRATQ
jgi:hypothetical protein